MILTLLTWQTALHEMYQLDSSVPATTDEDWTIRTNLLQTAINLWSGEQGILWRELFIGLAAAADGDKVTGTNKSTYAAPTDFVSLGGYVRTKEDGVNWTYWPVYDQPKSDLFKNNTVTIKFCWVTGNSKVGHTINFSVNPANAVTLDYMYYKQPFIPSASGDIIEMQDPYFALFYALSKLHENDGEGDRATLALSMAESRLKAMITQNAAPAPFQENYVPDRFEEIGYGGFGQ